MTFLAPARLGDYCDVITSTKQASPFRLILDQEIRRGDTVLTQAEIHPVCLDAAMTLREFPTELRT